MQIKIKTGIYKFSSEEFDKILLQAKDKPGYDKIKQLIDDNSFCMKSHTKENAHIPYQLHKAELKMILEQQKEQFPFLKQADRMAR